MNRRRVFKAYCKEKYRALWMAVRITFSALFARKGQSTHTHFDHGLLWKLLRDLWILVATLGRFITGVVVLVTLPILAIIGAVLRALAIPVIAAGTTLWLHYKTQKAQRKFVGRP